MMTDESPNQNQNAAEAANEPAVAAASEPAAAAANVERAAPAAPPPNPLERSVDYLFAADEVEGDAEKIILQKGQGLKLRGFRQGKVPLRILRQHFGNEATQQVLTQRAQKQFQEDMVKNQWRLAAAPAISPAPLASEGKYKVICYYEILPDIAAADLSKTTIKTPLLQVGEAQVDEMIEILREQQGEYLTHEGAAENGHRLVADFQSFLDGKEEPIAQGTDRHLVLGQLPDELQTALLGKKAGDVVRVSRNIPAAANDDAASGERGDSKPQEPKVEKAEMEITIKAVERLQKAELNEEFFTQLGVAEGGGMEAFRKMVKEHLDREVTVRLRNLRQKRAFDSLVAATAEFALPQTMIYRECHNLWQSLQQRHNPGKKPQAPKPEEMQMLVPEATRRVQLGLILSEWQKREQPEIKDEEINARLAQIAEDYEQSESKQEAIRNNPQQMDAVRLSVLEDKIVDWVYANATSEDEPLTLSHLLQDPAAGATMPPAA